jgi:hypothetical protein
LMAFELLDLSTRLPVPDPCCLVFRSCDKQAVRGEGYASNRTFMTPKGKKATLGKVPRPGSLVQTATNEAIAIGS